MGITKIPEIFFINIPTLFVLSSIIFTLTLGLFGGLIHWAAIIAERIKNKIVLAFLFSYICFLLTCILTVILLFYYRGWVCITSAVIIIISLIAISLILYYGIRALWEYVVYKTMEKI